MHLAPNGTNEMAHGLAQYSLGIVLFEMVRRLLRGLTREHS